LKIIIHWDMEVLLPWVRSLNLSAPTLVDVPGGLAQIINLKFALNLTALWHSLLSVAISMLMALPRARSSARRYYYKAQT
jgi:hypothetical protein